MHLWNEIIRLLKQESLYRTALEQCQDMLETDWKMFETSRELLRSETSPTEPPNLKEQDKEVNRGERGVRRKILTHLAIAGNANLPAGLSLVTIVVDIERIGDYTKNIADLAAQYTARLHAGSLEPSLASVERETVGLFENMILAFKSDDTDVGRKVMTRYKDELSGACDSIVAAIVKGEVTDLTPANASAVVLYARYLKRIGSHSRNIVSSIINPFHRIGYKEKPKT